MRTYRKKSYVGWKTNACRRKWNTQWKSNLLRSEMLANHFSFRCTYDPKKRILTGHWKIFTSRRTKLKSYNSYSREIHYSRQRKYILLKGNLPTNREAIFCILLHYLRRENFNLKNDFQRVKIPIWFGIKTNAHGRAKLFNLWRTFLSILDVFFLPYIKQDIYLFLNLPGEPELLSKQV